MIFNPLFLHNLLFDEGAMDTHLIKEEKTLADSTTEKFWKLMIFQNMLIIRLLQLLEVFLEENKVFLKWKS